MPDHEKRIGNMHARDSAIQITGDRVYKITPEMLVALAADAYSDRPKVDAVLPSAQVLDLRSDEVQAFLFRSEDQNVVAFRGTSVRETWDVIDDLWALPRKLKGMPGHLHGGFAAAAANLQQPLETMIRHCEALPGRIWLTGHSLGGAVAGIVAAYLHLHQVDVEAVCTFGAPRFATWKAARWLSHEFDGRWSRYELAGDPIPHLPGKWLGFGEVGTLIKLPRGLFGPHGVHSYRQAIAMG